ncbi:MAG: exodeoxyribonuclease VII large subunit, partial [Clostridia bacterium]|nr:exodeoxyribonuclease VII large subunit [Clostridia bacterium]
FSPLKVLSRGFSITEGPGGVVKSVSDVSAGDRLTIKLSDGAIGAEVV